MQEMQTWKSLVFGTQDNFGMTIVSHHGKRRQGSAMLRRGESRKWHVKSMLLRAGRKGDANAKEVR